MNEAAPNRWPAITASAALHAALLAAMLLVWTKPIKLSTVVPVTLVTSDQASEQRPAIAAPTPEPPAAEDPVPDAPAQVPAPETAPEPTPAPPPKPAPRPKPAPPAPAPPKPVPPKPTPKPTPKPAPQKLAPTPPAPAKPVAKTAPSTFDPDAVLASLSKSTKATGAKSSSLRRGPTRPETAVQARAAAGAGDAASASALTSLAASLQRLWNPNCEVAGAGDLDIRVTFRLSSSGRLVGSPQSSGDGAPDSSGLRVASDRAKRAVYAADSSHAFDTLPPSLYGQPITVKFNGQAACASG